MRCVVEGVMMQPGHVPQQCGSPSVYFPCNSAYREAALACRILSIIRVFCTDANNSNSRTRACAVVNVARRRRRIDDRPQTTEESL